MPCRPPRKTGRFPVSSRDSVLARAIGSDLKCNLSIAAYVLAILLASASPLASCAVYVAVAIVWLVPDRRIERVLGQTPE